VAAGFVNEKKGKLNPNHDSFAQLCQKGKDLNRIYVKARLVSVNCSWTIDVGGQKKGNK
jgi:hypothetical protein